MVFFYKGCLKLNDKHLPIRYSIFDSSERFMSTTSPIK